MNDDKTTQIDKALGALGTLERATEFRTFLLLANLAIALNTTLTLTHQTNLVGFSWQYVRDHLPIGQALVFLTGFTLYMSCVVGILQYFADQLVSWPVISLASFFRSYDAEANSHRRHRPNNRVLSSELLEAARDEDDREYLEQYNDHMDKRGVEDETARRTASLSFGLLVLLAIEAALPANASLSATFVRFLNSACSGLGNFIGVVVILVLLASWLFRFIEDDSDRRWVVCPKLYAKLERERQKEERERQTAIHRDRTY
ncbi:hypothetical protein [Paraburkholderia guartelaensis]|uniref:hypothetical protein n=1 Tax=Paraburkholderia guartelaensis TaxID=2546446 RepID=UPI002AB7B181|nr:hypothetical protein [Paraburkholderia guartelaensis]